MRSEPTLLVMSGEVDRLASRTTVPERTRRAPKGCARPSELVASLRVA
jgi:hypothetical protein